MSISPWEGVRREASVAQAPAFLSLSSLSSGEEALAAALVNQLVNDRAEIEKSQGFYDGTAPINSLGISVPPKLSALQTVLGWGRLACDSIAERLQPVGMRWPGDTDADSDLWNLWQANNLDEESSLAHVDALASGAGYLTVGSPDEVDGDPIIAVESPLTSTILWDARTRRTRAGLRLVKGTNADENMAVLYLPDETLTLAQNASRDWTVVDRDEHDLGRVPVVRMANRQRSHLRGGTSEITPEVRTIVLAAARTMLQLQVAGEFFSAPQRYVLGAGEDAFQNADGSTRSAWETIVGRILALERDEEGEVPTVGQFTQYSPAPYTEVLAAYAKLMASETGLPAHYFGFTTDNPSSADAIVASEFRLVRRVQNRQVAFGGAWEEAIRLALLLRDGDLPPEAARLETVWAAAGTPTWAATTDAITKQIAQGVLPAESLVALERLGYSPTEQERIEVERSQAAGSSALRSAFQNASAAANAPAPVADEAPAGGPAPASQEAGPPAGTA